MSTLEGVNGTTCDAQQYQQSSLPLTSPNRFVSCLTHGQTIGLALTAEASFISFTCILIIFVLIGRNILRRRRSFQNGDWKLFQVPADIYMFSLFMFDFIHAIGGILNVRWAGDGQVAMGSYCVAQGIIKQIGALGTALITLILAVHTFIAALWWTGIEARGVAFGLVSLTCVFIALWVGIGNGVYRKYEAPSPYWCWISPRFNAERLAGEYIWMWLALFTSVVMYIPLYLWAKGRLSVGERWYELHLSQPGQKAEYVQRRTSLGLLFYPLAYSLVVLPISIARWTQIHHPDIPSAEMLFGQSMINLSGAINVVLFLITRPNLLLFALPEMPIELELQTGPAILPDPDTVQYKHSPETRKVGVVDELEEVSWSFNFGGFRNSGAVVHVGSTQRDV